MVKKTKGKHRLDKYYHLAKEQGYRSRAAFKLIQLNRKYNFLANCKALLDLCAAPGGWMQVASKNMPLGSLIIGVDLMPIKPIRGAKSFVADITTVKCRQLLKKEAAGSLFDVVCHDGAPNVGGAWSSEAYTQSALVLDSLALAVEFLAPGGTFITKIFRSKDYNALLYALNQLFNKVEATKPQASRNASAEIFVVCLGYKAPAKVDPRLLDAKHLFQEVNEAPKVMGPEALLKQKIKQKRHREGYDEGLSSSHKAAAAAAFLLSDTPVEMLGQATQLVLDGKTSEQPAVLAPEDDSQQPLDYAALAAAIRSHPATDTEVRTLCKDLQVLGRSEFKQLLRWRLTLRKSLKDLLGGVSDAAKKGQHKKSEKKWVGGGEDGTGSEGDDDEEADPEQKLLDEMAAIRDQAEQRQRKEKRKRREVKKKAKVRAAQLLASEGTAADDGAPDGEQLFSLGVVPGDAAQLKKIAAAAAPGEQELEMLEDGYDSDQGLMPLNSDDDDSDGSSIDSDEEALDYEAQLEEQLEDAYQQYLHRKGVRDEAAKEKRQRLGKGGELGGSDDDGQQQQQDDAASSEDEEDKDEYAARLAAAAEESSEDEQAGGGLLVKLDSSRAGVAKGGAAAAAQWFGQELFDDPNVGVSSDEEDDETDVTRVVKKARVDGSSGVAVAGKAAARKPPPPAAAGDVDARDADEQQEQPTKQRKAAAAAVAGDAGPGFEEVRQPDSSDDEGGSSSSQHGGSSGSDDDSDAEEFDALDDNAKAEVLALAKRMLRRKEKESILEAAYNRYAFHDDKLPRWFSEDERRHMRPIPQVSKSDIEEEKARLAAIDARPIKKVAEAKARKRKRMQVRLEQARQKATSVAAQEDVPMASKMKEIEKIYAKARAANGVKGSKGKKGGRGDKRKGPTLDKRMKKDKRGMDRAAKRAGGKKGRGGGRKGGRR